MHPIFAVFIIIFTALFQGCGGSSSPSSKVVYEDQAPEFSNLAPTAVTSGRLNITFTIIGKNFPATLAVTIEDTSACTTVVNITTATITCDIPVTTKTQLAFNIKDKPGVQGGTIITGAKNLTLAITPEVNTDLPADNVVLGISFSDANFATCVQKHAINQQVLSLQELTALNCNSLNVAEVTELSYMTGLTSLYLQSNPITAMNLDANLNLTTVNLLNTSLNQQSLDYLATVTWVSNLSYPGSQTQPLVMPTGKLNDTGIITCSDANTDNLSCPVTGFEGQDAEHGRDARAAEGILTKVGAGKGGFDFTKLDTNGNALAASATQWSCVKDNHTGLIWEVKTDDSGLRDKDNTYSWYNANNATNGGDAGTENNGTCPDTGNCDTEKYVASVSVINLCGSSDWRLPAKEELRSIVDYSYSNSTHRPAIDTDYFLNTNTFLYWSVSPNAHFDSHAWNVNFANGNDYYDNKFNEHYVRLVRGTQ